MKRAAEFMAHAHDLLPEAAKPWTSKKPDGLFVLKNGITKDAASGVRAFLDDPANVVWSQRFGVRHPTTAHYNNARYGPYKGDEEQAEFKNSLPDLHRVVWEATDAMKAHLAEVDPDSSFQSFEPQSINIHKHEPGWGLGAHYDDTHHVGEGMVLMVSLGTERQFPEAERVPREFKFSDPVGGFEHSVSTVNRQVLLFKDECYDLWRHESVRNKKQTGTCLSFTIRLASSDGYQNANDDQAYPKGAPFAEKMAHKRIQAREKPLWLAHMHERLQPPPC